jgi:hypothetical protein
MGDNRGIRPQELKPASFLALGGTAEAMLFPKLIFPRLIYEIAFEFVLMPWGLMRFQHSE